MAFQNTVTVQQGFGVPGDFYSTAPSRVEVLAVNSNGANPNIAGYAYTKSNSTNTAVVGGAITSGSTVFAGLLLNSKENISHGTTSGTLEANLAVPDNKIASFCVMGDVVVRVSSACKIGDLLCYNTTTGALSTVAPGASAPSGSAIVPNAVIFKYPVASASGGVTVARLTN